MENAEHADIKGRAEMLNDHSGIFRVFRYFRVFRVLSLAKRDETILRSTGEMAHVRAALFAQRPFDAQAVAVELIERRGDRHRVFGRSHGSIIGLLWTADGLF